ncbi:MAG: MFS transporter [Actinobacteria bacterium]|nr:MFS transporter [Actinomycetota bacterium]MSX71142.1 MFS transporter [Actinomycetota bacterium]
MSKFAIDLSPLKKYPDFRNLWTSGLISYLGSMVTYVAIPFQIKELTNSYVAVGVVGAIEIIPLILFGLYGGVLADYVDRKKMVWATEAAALVLSAILLLNSLSSEPKVWVIYVMAGLFATVDGLQRPSADAILPRIVGHKDLPAASALMSLRWQMGVIIGPTIGGIVISTISISAGYGFDVITFLVSLIFLARVGSVPANPEAEKPSLRGLLDGIKYAFSRQDLLGTYLIDLAAMFFAMPTALYPFWADQLGAPWALGFLYAAVTAGSVVVTLTSGWVKTYRFHGRAIMWAAIGWGTAITLAGISNSLILVLLFLAIAGGADMISALFRGTIWNQSIPDNLRGRLAGIELLSYSIGPLAGQLRAASMAAATSLTFSVTAGGLICVFMVALLASFLPKFRKYDAETNEFAVAMRKIRELEQKSTDEK